MSVPTWAFASTSSVKHSGTSSDLRNRMHWSTGNQRSRSRQRRTSRSETALESPSDVRTYACAFDTRNLQPRQPADAVPFLLHSPIPSQICSAVSPLAVALMICGRYL